MNRFFPSPRPFFFLQHLLLSSYSLGSSLSREDEEEEDLQRDDESMRVEELGKGERGLTNRYEQVLTAAETAVSVLYSLERE